MFNDRPLRLDINQSGDSGHDPFADTNDSGVGPSPRAPGRGSLEESDAPPAWLQDVSLYFETKKLFFRNAR